MGYKVEADYTKCPWTSLCWARYSVLGGVIWYLAVETRGEILLQRAETSQGSSLLAIARKIGAKLIEAEKSYSHRRSGRAGIRSNAIQAY